MRKSSEAKKLEKKLKVVGYQLYKADNHSIYERLGSCPVQVTNHYEINEYTTNTVLKSAGII